MVALPLDTELSMVAISVAATVLSLPDELIDPLPSAISPGTTSVDVTLSKLLRTWRGNENDIHIRDVMNVLGLLLNADDFVDLTDKFDDQQDAESLIDMLLYLFDKGLTDKIGMTKTKANSRARRLVIKIAARLTTAPKFLFLDSDEISIPSGLPIDGGGLAFVYRSSYRGAQVALKRVRNCKIDKAFLQEALTWRTLSHEHILPFIGILVDHSQSFVSLVSPFMENGTLRDWRRKMMPSVSEIKRCIHEVAAGLVYLHTEGIVHGDLKGSNVLLDSEFHVKISDFGSTKHTDSTGTKTWATTIRFAAPELFSDEEDQVLWKRTKETDIYAFGCLYYEIHFGILPFGAMNEYSIVKRIKMGKRPILHPHLPLDDHGAKLINQCWDQDPLKRPKIEDVACSFNCLKL